MGSMRFAAEEGSTVSIVVRFTPKGLAAEQYDRTVRLLEEREGAWPPDGLDYHVCFGSVGNLLVSEVWTRRERFEAAGFSRSTTS